MCGIVGTLSPRTERDQMEGRLAQMAAQITHRGPDDEGIWTDPRAGLGLAFRRLAIIDLTQEGHQPMVSACQRYVLVYNGEIYNFEEIRREVQESGRFPHAFRGHSDTEVLLAAISCWGLEATLPKLNGMFALALWDREERELTLVRDRLGIKPLYYGLCGQTFFFGSELKSFKCHPEFLAEIDRSSLGLLLRHNYIPAPHCIYKGFYKLQPGHFLKIDADLKIGKSQAYWSAKDVCEAGLRNPYLGREEEAVGDLETLLMDSIRQRMVADVPLGAFLSGGIDSSLVVALMQAQSNRPVKTFTIGFSEKDYNEADEAKAIANHLHTDHTELYVTPGQARDVIPKLGALYDEPFADSSQIPTYLVSQLARQHVTVSLSGDGGDELFGGYNRYFWGRKIWNTIRWMPKASRHLSSKLLSQIPTSAWDGFFKKAGPILPKKMKVRNPADKAQKLSRILGTDSPQVLYHHLVSHWKKPWELIPGYQEPLTQLTDPSQWPEQTDFTEQMMFLDLVTYLPDDILAKVDRASMGVSLEVRVPLLDHRVVAFAMSLPLKWKVRGDEGKHLLRRLLYRYVPKPMLDRPKMGFGVPIDHWLRGPLRDWAESLMAEDRLKREGLFNPGPIREKWKQHLARTHNWQHELWDILMFQVWQEGQTTRPRSRPIQPRPASQLS